MPYDTRKATEPDPGGDDPDYLYIEAEGVREARMAVHAPDDWPVEFVRRSSYGAIYRLPHGWEDEPDPVIETEARAQREAYLRGRPTNNEESGE